jgi:hypothetical protein
LKRLKLNYHLEYNVLDFVVLDLWEIFFIAIGSKSIDYSPNIQDYIWIVVISKCSEKLQLRKQQLNFLLSLRTLLRETLLQLDLDAAATLDGIGWFAWRSFQKSNKLNVLSWFSIVDEHVNALDIQFVSEYSGKCITRPHAMIQQILIAGWGLTSVFDRRVIQGKLLLAFAEEADKIGNSANIQFGASAYDTIEVAVPIGFMKLRKKVLIILQ